MPKRKESDQKYENKRAGKRTRNWATIVYKDSAPENWQEIISDLHIPAFISPYHDKDFTPEGSPKKPHYHVVLMFDSVKTKEQIQEIISKFNGVGVEQITTIRGYSRYLCHLDDPNKAQYNTADVIQLGGADYISTIGLPTDKYKAIKEMMDFCRENGVLSYADLLDYSSIHHFDWFRVLCDNGTVVMKEYLKSLNWTIEQTKKR